MGLSARWEMSNIQLVPMALSRWRRSQARGPRVLSCWFYYTGGVKHPAVSSLPLSRLGLRINLPTFERGEIFQ